MLDTGLAIRVAGEVPMAASSDRWLAIKELAALVGVSERSVRRWIADGEPGLEVLRIGGVIRVRPCPHTSSSRPSDEGSESDL